MAIRSLLRSQITNAEWYDSFLAGNEPTIPISFLLSSAPLWLDASDASTITESGGSVSQWDNKGTLENFTQATSADQPTTGSTTVNDRNVIDFADDFLGSSTAADWKFLHDGTTYFVAAVIKYGNSADPGVKDYIIGTNGNSSSNIGISLQYDDRNTPNDAFRFDVVYGLSGSRAVQILDNDFLTANTFTITSFLTDPDNGTAADRINYFVNDTEGLLANTDNNTPSTSNPTYSLQVGANGNDGDTFTGSIGELIIVSGADATEGNRQKVVDYLNAKWGIF